MKKRRVIYRKSVLLVFLSITALHGYTQEKYYNVCEHIPETGKSIKITEQLQSLIDEASASGGGIIYFPAGEYLTGTLFMKDNTYLEIGAGATLFGSTEMEDYYHDGLKSLIYSNGAKNCGILGQGTINGQGDFFWRGKDHPYTRPDRFVLFENCSQVKISDITLINSPNWNVDIRFCENVWIEGVSILSERKAPNTDGIDPVSSRNVFISNCYIDVGDDAICPKTRGDRPLENLVVTNCILISDDSAIKFGTRSDSDMRNMVFSNIVIRNTEYGIAFYAKDGGIVENIRFENIHIETTLDMAADVTKPMGTYPLFMDLETRSRNPKLGAIRNIYFSDITIDSPEGHCLFLGQPDSKLENIHLNNIHYTLHKRGSFEGNKKPRGVRSLKDKAANDYSDVYSHFTFAYMQGLKINNLFIKDLSGEEEFERRMLWGYDIHDVTIHNFSNKLNVPNQELPQIHFKESSSIEITSSSPTATETPLLFLEGATRDVLVHNNDFRKIRQISASDGEFDQSELLMINNVTKKEINH
jgi:hypothetical protein